jgi:integrase
MRPLSRQERPTLTLEQAYRLFESTQDDWLHALYVVLATTGLRLGEALGLSWDDVDLSGQTLSIRQALQRQTGKGQVTVPLKTSKSRRVVPLMKVATDAIRRHKTRQIQQRLLLSINWPDTSHVFTSETGTLLDQSNVRDRRYYPALKAAGLPHVRLHDLRHTASTLMASEGIPMHMVQAVLGHARSSTTMDIYTHVLDTSFQEVRDKMDAAYDRIQLRAAEVAS